LDRAAGRGTLSICRSRTPRDRHSAEARIVGGISARIGCVRFLKKSRRRDSMDAHAPLSSGKSSNGNQSRIDR
jgi:hypothetical protein